MLHLWLLKRKKSSLTNSRRQENARMEFMLLLLLPVREVWISPEPAHPLL